MDDIHRIEVLEAAVTVQEQKIEGLKQAITLMCNTMIKSVPMSEENKKNLEELL